MRKLFVCIFVLLYMYAFTYSESSELSVKQMRADDGISIFCISTDYLSSIPVDGQQHVQHIAEPDQISEILSSMLNMKEREAFLQEYDRTGYAKLTVCLPSLDTILNCELGTWVSKRKIDNTWMLVHYSLVTNKDMYTTMTVAKYTLVYEDAILHRTFEGSTELEVHPAENRLSRDCMEFFEQTDGTKLALSALEEGDIAFITDTDGYADQVLNVYIDCDVVNQIVGIEQRNGSVLYICPLEKEEIENIRAGSCIQILP